MDPIKILRRAWHILWSYRALWVFGLILALAGAGSSGNGGNNNVQYRIDEQNHQAPLPQSIQEGFKEFTEEAERLFNDGLSEVDIPGEELTTLLWVLYALVAGARKLEERRPDVAQFHKAQVLECMQVTGNRNSFDRKAPRVPCDRGTRGC